MDRRRVLALIQEEHDHQPQFFKANHDMHAPRLLEISQELATRQDRLASVAREALAALDDLIQYCDDPGSAALGARYLLAQELVHHPAPDAPATDPAAATAELRAKHFTEAAEMLQQADCAANETDGMDHAADLLTIAAVQGA